MPKRSIRPDDLLRLTLVGDPQLSPSGDRVLFSKKIVTEKNKPLSHICSVDLEGTVRTWTQGEASCSAARWSPDGQWISFISSRSEGISQLFLLSTHGGEATCVTRFPEGSVGAYQWSPDSAKIALTFRETAADMTSAAAKARSEKGLSAPPLVFDDIKYRLDGDGYFANQRYELLVLDIDASLNSGCDSDRCILFRYRQDVHGNYDFDWSPDSKELAVVHSVNKRPFAEAPNDQIWRLDCTNGGKARLVEGLPKGDKSCPVWSPDAQWIAYAGNVDEDDPWGVRNTKIYVVSANGGEPKDLLEGQDFSATVATLSDTQEAGFSANLQWAPDGSGLFAQIGTKGGTQLGFASIQGGLTILTEGRHTLGIGTVDRAGTRIAAVAGTAVKLAEVAVLEPELVTGRWVPKILTDLNHAFHSEVEVIEPEEIWIPTTDGLNVHAWALKPTGASASDRKPAVLQIHGGPHAQYGWTFFHELQCQAAAGYVVVYSNPRGSTGYGEAWTSAIQRNWGDKDWQDIQSVTSWMQEHPEIDPARIAIMGGSYGGYMTNWAIGHSKAYRCAITDRCVSNLVSMAGNSDFPVNKNGYFRGLAYGDLKDIESLWEQSPIAYFKDVTTPTLVIHSAGDLRCNIEQSEQVFTALQQEGIDSRMVRYPETTSHGMSRSGPPDLRIHRLNEILSWLNKYLQ